MNAEIFWIAALAASCFGLAYYRFVLIPLQTEARMEGAVRAFSAAIELRFPSHAGLTDAVVSLSRRVAFRLGLGPKRQRRLERAVRVRDIGLCAIPYRLVNQRSWEEWTLAETATYDCHPEVGGAILETVPALSNLAQTVRLHHASFADEGDGSTPPLEACIVKACAEFVWYRRHRGLEAAIEHLRTGSGTLYDPAVAQAVLDCGDISAAVHA